MKTNNQRRLSSLTIFVIGYILVTVISSLGVRWIVPPQLEVHFINVTQNTDIGDSILLRSSEGKVMLIDGGSQGTGALDYLLGQNVTYIDTVVLTHAHEDHYGGLIEILSAIPVGQLVTNGETSNEPLSSEFQQAVEKSGVKMAQVKTGDQLPFGRLTFNVLSPQKINPNSINNNSIVLRLAVGQVDFLFVGDIMELQENWLLATGAPVKADILKVAHHAIGTSSKGPFILKVKPEVAIYSVNAVNPYGAPDGKVLENLKAVGAEVYGTENYGTIKVLTDGRTYRIETEKVPVDEQ